MCLYPTLIENRRYLPNKKNGGKPPPVIDIRTSMVPVGCGNCMECRKQKARAWQIRLTEDIKTNTNGKFITLTFSNESIKHLYNTYEELRELEGYTLDNAIATKATRLFLERWRKKNKKSLRHFLVTELGHEGTENIHLHGIVWTDETMEMVEKTWAYGFMWKGYETQKNYVTGRTVNYIIKYITKADEDHPNYKSKILTTPGIGSEYSESFEASYNKYKENGETNESYKTEKGHKLNLPIYYRNKIYTEAEREKLWIEKLDKGERWICGEKVNELDTKSFYRTMKWYRRVNRELGYGDDVKDYNQMEYEKMRRKLQMAKRLENKK